MIRSWEQIVTLSLLSSSYVGYVLEISVTLRVKQDVLSMLACVSASPLFEFSCEEISSTALTTFCPPN